MQKRHQIIVVVLRAPFSNAMPSECTDFHFNFFSFLASNILMHVAMDLQIKTSTKTNITLCVRCIAHKLHSIRLLLNFFIKCSVFYRMCRVLVTLFLSWSLTIVSIYVRSFVRSFHFFFFLLLLFCHSKPNRRRFKALAYVFNLHILFCLL